MQPVWVLSVDLQTKTATFQSGLADAARSARGAFQDIGDSAKTGLGRVTEGTTDVRHSLGLMDNAIRGNHAAAMVDMIRLMQNSSIVMAALPFAGTVGAVLLLAGGVVELVKHLQEWKAAQEKLTEDTAKFHTTIAETFDGVNDKILQAQKQTDELRGNHLGALQKELELIDHQSMDELARAFDTVAKAADNLFGELKSSWYETVIGSEGARHALEQFQAQYKSLLAQRKDKEASDLLGGTLGQAQKLLALQNELKGMGATDRGMWGMFGYDPSKAQEAIRAYQILKSNDIGFTDKEVQSQKALVDALSAQVEIQQKINTLKSTESGNARSEASKSVARDQNEIASRLAEGRALYMRDLYEQYTESRQAVEQGERDNVAATKEGTMARLAALSQAMAEERSLGLEDTTFYADLQRQRIETIRQMGEQEVQLRAEMGQEAAEQDLRMGQLRLAAARDELQSVRSLAMLSANGRIAAEMALDNQEYQLQRTALQQQLQALNQFAQDYAAKKQQLNDKLLQLDQQHANQEQQLQDKMDSQSLGNLTSAQAQLVQMFNQGFARVLTGKESFAHMMQTLDSQVAEGMIQNALRSIEAENMTKERDAARAARMAFNAGWQFPFPANIVMAPMLAAGAFAAQMAFAGGGIVPGTGIGDTVHAALTPGEAVLPKQLTEMLMKTASSGSGGQPQHVVHMHYRPTFHVQAIDGDGVQDMLDKHTATFTNHFHKVVRGMNK